MTSIVNEYSAQKVIKIYIKYLTQFHLYILLLHVKKEMRNKQFMQIVANSVRNEKGHGSSIQLNAMIHKRQ